MNHKISAPFGWTWRDTFSSDGSESTGSLEREGQKFTVLRQLTDDECEPCGEGSAYPSHIPMYEIQFEDGTKFHAWDDEIVNELIRG